MKPPLGHRRLHCLLTALIVLAPEYRDAFANAAEGDEPKARQEDKRDGESKSAATPRKVPDEKCPGTTTKVGSDQLRLIFKGETLEKIATAFNRCNLTPQIRVVGRSLQGRRYTIMVDADDPNSFLDYLAIDENIVIEIEGAQQFVVRLRSPNSIAPQQSTAGQRNSMQSDVRK